MIIVIQPYQAAAPAALSVVLQENFTANPAWTNVTGVTDIEYYGASTPGPDSIPYSLKAVASGGTPPYTYAWSRVSGSSEFSADSSTSAETSFTVDSAGNGYTIEDAMWKCTVTDALSATADPATNANIYVESGV